MATLASSGGPLGNPITYLTYLLRHRTQILAPWIVASSLDLFLGGIYLTLLVQFFFPSNHDCHARRSSSSRRKATNEPKSFLARIISRLPDSPTIIFLVCLVAIFTILKSTAALYILFLNSIVLSDSPLKLAIASFHNWVMVASPLTTHFIDLAVQSYYIILLYNLFRADAGLHFGPFLRWSLFTGIALCFTLATITGILAVYEVLSFRFQHPDLYVLIQLASSFVGDALISGGTVYCLLKSSAHNLRNRSAFTRFARTIALSASLPALLALFNLCIVASNIYFNRWHIVFDFSLSKAFSISFMWTIRIRRKMVRRSATDRMGGNGVGGGGGGGGGEAGVGGAGGGTGCSCSCCGCDYHSGQNRASKRFEFSERGRESRHYGHSPADEYFANPSMFAATMPPQRTQTEHCIEMGQYVKTNHGEVDVIHLDVREPSMPQPTVAKSKESFTRSGSSERSSSSPVHRTTFLKMK